jgi:exonuclease SbcC
MRLCSVRMRGLGPFRDEVKLDMSQLGDATLVAVCGDNGEGKSTFLEFAVPGAYYRQTPTQGSMKSRAADRDTLLEVVVETDTERYTIRHMMDAVSGKGTSIVLNQANTPVYGSDQVSAFDAWAKRHLPPAEVLLASTFGAQKDDGFLGAEPGDRKAILLRALGIARYEAWASGASKRASGCKQQLEVTRARVADARRTGGDVNQLTIALADAEVEGRRADDALTAARRDLADLEDRARAARDGAAATAAHASKHAELLARVQGLQAKLDDIATRIAACNRTLGAEKQIRDAAAKLDGLKRQLEELSQQRPTLSARQESARQRARAAQSFADAANRQRDRVAVRITELEQLVARGAEIAKAEADLREVEAGLVTLRAGVTSAQAALDELTAATVAGAEGRIKGLRGGLTTIAFDECDEAAIAKDALEADDAVVKQASERPARLATARQALEQTRGLLSSAEKRQQILAALARRAGEVTAARDQLASLRTELAQHADAARGHEATSKEAAALDQATTTQLDALQLRHQALTQQADGLRPLAEQLANIALAASKLEERQSQQAEVSGELEAATWALSELGPPPAAVAVPDVAPLQAKVTELERAARAAHQAAGVAASKLDGARKVAQQVADLEAQQRSEETELSDWTRLAEDLGRKGLQAAEIDSCGPELTALVNDLLHTCHGPRWTVRIETQRPSADGKKEIEGCWVTVIDTVTGREDDGSKYSGGQCVIIGEACALGLALLAFQRSGLRGVTLVRDETGAALDPSNAEAYLKMLRRAAKQIGADRVLFVCHNPAVTDLADARITVSGGKLLIDAQAGRVAA